MPKCYPGKYLQQKCVQVSISINYPNKWTDSKINKQEKDVKRQFTKEEIQQVNSFSKSGNVFHPLNKALKAKLLNGGKNTFNLILFFITTTVNISKNFTESNSINFKNCKSIHILCCSNFSSGTLA